MQSAPVPMGCEQRELQGAKLKRKFLIPDGYEGELCCKCGLKNKQREQRAARMCVCVC